MITQKYNPANDEYEPSKIGNERVKEMNRNSNM